MNPPVTVGFATQTANDSESMSMLWRLHEYVENEYVAILTSMHTLPIPSWITLLASGLMECIRTFQSRLWNHHSIILCVSNIKAWIGHHSVGWYVQMYFHMIYIFHAIHTDDMIVIKWLPGSGAHALGNHLFSIFDLDVKPFVIWWLSPYVSLANGPVKLQAVELLGEGSCGANSLAPEGVKVISKLI